jgi:hypothetical protein
MVKVPPTGKGLALYRVTVIVSNPILQPLTGETIEVMATSCERPKKGNNRKMISRYVRKNFIRN